MLCQLTTRQLVITVQQLVIFTYLLQEVIQRMLQLFINYIIYIYIYIYI